MPSTKIPGSVSSTYWLAICPSFFCLKSLQFWLLGLHKQFLYKSYLSYGGRSLSWLSFFSEVTGSISVWSSKIFFYDKSLANVYISSMISLDSRVQIALKIHPIRHHGQIIVAASATGWTLTSTCYLRLGSSSVRDFCRSAESCAIAPCLRFGNNFSEIWTRPMLQYCPISKPSEKTWCTRCEFGL